MTRIWQPVSTMLLVLAMSGCGDSASNVPASSDPSTHGGEIVELPANQGYVEIVSKSLGREAAKRASHQYELYFLSPDRKAALSPAPTGVSLEFKGLNSSTLALKDSPEGAFISPPSAPPGERAVGEIVATIGGQQVRAPFSLRQ